MKNAAIIIETRELSDLPDVVNNHLSFLPEDFELIVVGSAQNEKQIRYSFPQVIFREIDYFQFLKQHGSLPHINSRQYNDLLTHVGFWEWLQGFERVLVFQHDSLLLRKGIERFYDWDYIGAPWYHIPICGGNGGLSLRNPKKMLRLCQIIPYRHNEHGNEDVYFSKHLDLVGGKVACQNIAKEFSVETIFYPTPIGCHAPEKYLRPHELKQLYA